MEIKTRVPGVVSELNVAEGQQVEVKDQLAVMEAMKMFQPVLSPVAGTVAEIMVEQGQRVSGGAVLMIVEE